MNNHEVNFNRYLEALKLGMNEIDLLIDKLCASFGFLDITVDDLLEEAKTVQMLLKDKERGETDNNVD